MPAGFSGYSADRTDLWMPLRAAMHEMPGSDPLVLAAAGALMLFVAMLAAWLPGGTASRTDPNLLLRSE